METASLGEVEEVVCRWAGRIAAATCGWLVALAAFDRREGWSGIGMGSCAHWLAWRCGLGLRTAREYVATARALEGLPAIRAAFAAGTLSYSKVRAVTRVADASTEQVWLSHARFCTAGQVERLVRSYRQARGDQKVRRASRRLSWRFDDDGMLCLQAVLSADEGAQLIAALDAARASLDDTTPLGSTEATTGDAGSDDAGSGDAGSGELPADGESVVTARDRQRDADALIALADGFLDRSAPGLTTPGHTLTVHLTTRPTGDTPTADASPAVGPQDSAAVGDGGSGDATAEGVAGLLGVPRIGIGAWAQIDGGIGLPPQVVERLGCDGLIRALLTDPEGNPLHLGRRQRQPGPRLRDAVYARDQGRCQYPGCGHTRWLQIHHLSWWIRGGDTDIDRLLLLCSAHHRAIHEDNISLRRTDDGTVTAHPSDGRTLTPAPPVLAGPDPAGILARATRHIDPAAIHTRDGGRLSYDDSLHAILSRTVR
ncbi:HNH endonuclease [Frankia sp. ACN1ag]|nr:HNH endonuclease [Frankia sp. ACN1ag]